VFSIALQSAGLEVEVNDLGVSVANATVEDVRGLIEELSSMTPIPAADLAAFVENLRTAKYDEFVPEALLRRLWARDRAPLANQIQSAALRLLQDV
jgi:ATP-dependent Lhr-like helicase